MASKEEIHRLMETITKSFATREKVLEITTKSITSIFPLDNDSLLIGFDDGTLAAFVQHIVQIKEVICGPKSVIGILKIKQALFACCSDGVVLELKDDYTKLRTMQMGFDIEKIEYSNESNYLVIGTGTTIRYKFFNDSEYLDTDLENFTLTFPFIDFKIFGLYLFISTSKTFEKWNLKTKTKEKSLEIEGITCIGHNPKNCYVAIKSELMFLPHSGDTIAGPITDDVKVFSVHGEKFLFTLGKDIKIIDVSAGPIILATVVSHGFVGSSLCIKKPYLYILSRNKVRKLPYEENFGFKQVIEADSTVIDFFFARAGPIVVATKDNSIIKYDTDFGKMVYIEKCKKIYPEDTISCLASNESASQFAVGNCENTIKLYSISDFTELETLTHHKYPILHVFYINSCLVSVASDSKALEIYFSSADFIKTMTGNYSFFASNNNYLIFAGDYTLYIMDTHGNTIEKPCNEKEIIKIDCNDDYLVIIDKEVTIRETQKFGMICNVDYSQLKEGREIKSLCIVDDYVIMTTSRFVHILSIQNKVFLGSIEMQFQITSVRLFAEKLYMCVDNKIFMCKNIFSYGSEPFLIGPQIPSLAFSEYFHLALKEDVLPDHVYNWTIMPECINIVHLLAYNSKIPLLKESFKKKTNFLKSRIGISPLTIALRKDYRDTIEYLIKKIARASNSGSYPFIMSVIEADLPDINMSNVSSISDLYREAMCAPYQYNLPNYGRPITSEKMIVSTGYYVNPEDFLSNDQGIPEEYVTFLTSTLRLHFSIGSLHTIEFLKSLLLCNDSDVFSTPLIHNYLNFKWENAQFILKAHSIAYFIFLLLLTLDASISSDYRFIPLIIVITLNFFDLFYEFLQMHFNIYEYFTSKTNWLDLCRIFLIFYFALSEMIASDGTLQEYADQRITFTTIIILVSYLRGILYFKMFKSTRYMIKMIEEIFKDSIYFGVLLIYILLALTTFFHFASFGQDYFTSFTTVYTMTYGEFKFNENSLVQWLCFYLISLTLPLIMFNLLVAIMTGTYQRVYDGMVEMDFKAMTQLILETEIILSFFTNDDSSIMYLQKCIVGSEHEEDVGDRLKYKLKNCTNHINELSLALQKSKDSKWNKLVEYFDKAREDRITALEAFQSKVLGRKTEILEILKTS